MKKKIAFTLTICLIVTTMIFVTGFSASDTKLSEGIFQRVSFIDGKINAADVNLREGITTEHKVAGVLEKGTDVKILGRLDNWYAIYVPSKKTIGVVDSRFITAKDTGSSSDSDSVSAKVAANTNTPAPESTMLDKDEKELLEILNNARKNAGLEPLSVDTSLQKAAEIKAKDMASNNYFGHKSPTYGSPFDLMRRSGIVFKSAGENLAGNDSAREAASTWMDNDNHIANILNADYKYVGIGVTNDDTYGKLFVAEFIEK